MYWADEYIKKIPNKKAKHRVDDMKTVSGMPHVGSLRALVTHDILYKAMKDANFQVDFTYVFNDMDPMDGLPVYLDENKYRPHMGKPLYKIPSPKKGYKSFGEYYALQFKKAFNKINCQPTIIWSHEVYASGQMDKTIKTCLDNADKIRRIYKKVAGYNKPKDWLPYQVICPQCGKVGTTFVSKWNGTYVTYECKKDLVDWAVGCGHKGKVKPKGENGKLMWKVDWPAHWKELNVTVECAGKDHFSEGGSRDIGVAICKNVLKTKPPIGWLHEFFLIGGQKMSSSKGAGIGADKITTIIPPELVRFLIVKTHIRRAVSFDPGGMTVPDLYDAFDEAAQAYWNQTDNLSSKSLAKKDELARIYELSQIKSNPPKSHFLPRFRDIANFIQYPEIDVYKKCEEIKGSKLSSFETDVLEDRVKYAQIWLDNYAPQEAVFIPNKNIPDEAADLTQKQKDYLQAVSTLLNQEWKEPEEFQQALFTKAKELGIPTREAFTSIYLSLIGKNHGPRAAWFLLEYKNIALTRFKHLSHATEKRKTKLKLKVIKSDKISLHSNFREKYPSATIGFALIKGVEVKKLDSHLEKERQEFIKNQPGLTTTAISNYPEIQSYRRMYKDMGIDWHSRRPSPEALLRRIAQGKNMPPINTAVDSYNLVVMRNRVSVGVFDADAIEFPCQVKIASGGEKALFIGDEQETELKAGEVCYFDQIGAYNMDYNYRDALRSLSTEKTKNFWINAEGVYDITPQQVEKALLDAINMLTKYCGGKVIQKGIITAT